MTIQSDIVAAAPVPSAAIAAKSDASARQLGILLMMGAYATFACLDTTAKWLAHSVPVMEVVWARYVGATIFAMLVVKPFSAPNVLRTNRFWLQAGRSFTLFASTVLNFFALQYLQLAETVSIAFALPLVVALMAGPLLGEWVGPRRMAAICVGFLGVLVVAQPGFGRFHPAMLLIVVGVFCYAAYGISTRMLAATDSSRTTLTYSSLLGAVALTPALPWFWVWPQSTFGWFLLALTGVFGGFGHWLMIVAHRHAPASILAPFVYTELLWMVLLGFLVFGDVPGVWTLAGGGIVICSGLYLWYRERVTRGA